MPRVLRLTRSDLRRLERLAKEAGTTPARVLRAVLQDGGQAAARSGRSVAELVREAIRKVMLKPQGTGPVALWDGVPRRTSIEHDSVHDEP
jgi:hypothetical protein